MEIRQGIKAASSLFKFELSILSQIFTYPHIVYLDSSVLSRKALENITKSLAYSKIL